MKRLCRLVLLLSLFLVSLFSRGWMPAAAQDDTEALSLSARTLRGDRALSEVLADGDVEIVWTGFSLRADHLRYDYGSDTITAWGNVKILGIETFPIDASRITTDPALEHIFAADISVPFGEGRLAARRTVAVSGSGVFFDKVSATPCEICTGKPAFWSVRAGRAHRREDGRRIVFDDAVLRILGIPVLYAPAISIPSPEVPRASGFLIPEIGYSSLLGISAKQPVYLALTPDQDVTVSALLATQSNPLAGLSYRARFGAGHIDLDSGATWETRLDDKGRPVGTPGLRGHLSAAASVAFGRSWQFGIGIERQSDPLYDQRYGIARGPGAYGMLKGRPRTLLSQFFLANEGASHVAAAHIFSFQDLTGTDDAGRPPILPYVTVQTRLGTSAWGHVDASLSAFAGNRSSGATLAARDVALGTPVSEGAATASLDWGHRIIVGRGVLLAPFAQARIDSGWTEEGRQTRLSGLAGGQISWPLIASTGENRIFLEPRLWLAAETSNHEESVPLPGWAGITHERGANPYLPLHGRELAYRERERIPYAFAGMDSVVNLGRKAELRVSLGRRWHRFLPDQPPILGADYLADARLSIGMQSASSRLVFDRNALLRAADFGLGFDSGRWHGQIEYFLSRTGDSSTRNIHREGGRVLVSFRLDENWSFRYSQETNVAGSFDIKRSAAIIYDGSCATFRLFYQYSGVQNGFIQPSSSVSLSLELKAFGPDRSAR